MKLGVFTVLLGNMSAADAFKYLKNAGAQAIELGCGGYPGNAHCNPEELLKDQKKLDEFKALIADSGMTLSALSCHGNMIHPDKEIAASFQKDLLNTIRLAEKLGIDRVVTFSGCPGGSKADMTPNWVTCPWPDDFLHILDYQWNEVLIPYWKETVKFAKDYGVDKIGFEMHPGFCVYNPATLLRLREAVGPEIGANFDPSHLIWQGIDPCVAIKELKDCMWHFHAKDTKLDKYNIAKNGVLDTKHYSDVANRGWSFRSVGYGNSEQYWKDIVSALRTIDYDYVMSIEHEDILLSPSEGLSKAISVLKNAMTFEDKGSMWWA